MTDRINKTIKWTLLLTIGILFLASAEALLTAKSSEAWQSYRQLYTEANYGDFLAYVLSRYLSVIIAPLVVSLYLFLTRAKIRANGLQRFVLGGIVLIGIINLIFTFNFSSVFYYLTIILQIMLLLVVAGFSQEQNTAEDKR